MTSREFWARGAEELERELGSGPNGLTAAEALARGRSVRPLQGRRRSGPAALLLAQFASPILLILLAAAVLSAFLGDSADALIILAIVVASGLLGFAQEYSAVRAVDRLLQLVHTTVRVVRGGREREVPLDEVVPGDVAVLTAGDAVPGDCLLLEGRDLFVEEAALTGESLPAEKEAGPLAAGTPMARRRNSLFFGTHVASGTARVLVVGVGRDTVFGEVAGRLRLRPPETAFERGVRRFGGFLAQVTFILVLSIFALNVYFHRPVVDSFLFALALAVGLTPQLLPAVISVNLARGARRMAEKKVIVRRLASLENFGSMDLLCCDKTGTLTEGVVRVRRGVDGWGGEGKGSEGDEPLGWAWVNATNESGFVNPIDAALRGLGPEGLPAGFAGWAKLDEIPYDFHRKRLSVLVARGGRRVLVTKGALDGVLAVCGVARHEGSDLPLADCGDEVRRRMGAMQEEGYRLIGVAVRELATDRATVADETGMTFLGALVLEDPPKAGISDTLAELRGLGVTVKVITGDDRRVAGHLGRAVGMPAPVVVTGAELSLMTDEALRARAPGVDIFAEVEPHHKERIILALRRSGRVVGFLGDGINDASALHAADVGISVAGAADAAREAADLVLLEKDLGALGDGVRAGRATFANTLKYVHMATSANFGNMFSMAAASLFLPFLPLLPKQILLTNLLTDLPEMTIAGDRVDDVLVCKPQRWDIGAVRRFMTVFGILSSLFDLATFAALMLLLRASPELFRTGWFVESVVSAAAVVLVVRTRGPAWKSLPGRGLLAATASVAAAAMALPFTPLAGPFGFVPLPPLFLLLVAGLVAAYLLSAEGVKRVFYRKG